MNDFDALRRTMVDAQVRANDVADPRIHAAMLAVPRERFVPTAKRAFAYADVPAEVAPQRYILDPRTFGKMVQLAEIQITDRILDIGCATGYSSAILARLGKEVVALEQDADLVRMASEILPTVGETRIAVVQGGLVEGVKGLAPFDVIFINGAIETVPDALFGQLAEGGRLVTVLQQNAAGKATLFVKQNGAVGHRTSFDAGVPMLAGFRKAVGFVF
ncbi:MAG TPA: protein-L-isoaspartate O-methyltransferase [Rhizomicrobium sp.]|jgi:protein-L-isoaspartate(D-aspartate) O-methyltransferase